MVAVTVLDLLVSAALSVVILWNLGRQVAGSAIESLSFKLMGIWVAIIAIKRFYILFDGNLSFDVNGFIFRVMLLVWLTSNMVTAYCKGVAVMFRFVSQRTRHARL